MKNTSTILSILAVVGVIVLFILHFSNNQNGQPAPASKGDGNTVATTRIAYVDIDTFEANYEFLKVKKEEFASRQRSMRNELERSARQLQANVEEFQRKAQSGSITQSEGQATERQLLQIQQRLSHREQSLTEQLLKEQDDFNVLLRQQLDSFLTDYNRDSRYDYILSYSRISPQILHANQALDITKDVIEGMNKWHPASKDSVKKK